MKNLTSKDTQLLFSVFILPQCGPCFYVLTINYIQHEIHNVMSTLRKSVLVYFFYPAKQGQI